MKHRSAWTLLLGLGLTLASAGTVLASMDGDLFATDATLGGDHGYVASNLVDSATLDVDTFDEAGGFDGCNGDGLHGLGAVADIDAESEARVRHISDVDADEDEILLGIALAHNGATGVSFNTLSDMRAVSIAEAEIEEDVDLDREDVFSALALGYDADSTSTLEALSCVRDLDREVEQRVEAEREIDLDDDNVLLAIAVDNAVGGGIDLTDVASLDIEREAETQTEQDVDLDRRDAFLALALGAGGHHG